MNMIVNSFFIHSKLPKISFVNCLRPNYNRRFGISSSISSLATIPSQEIEKHSLLGRDFYIKRDDQYHFHPDIGISGNKVRKLNALLSKKPFPSLVISSGGNQSNAMRALALLCQYYNSKFIYFTSTLSRVVKDSVFGNYNDSVKAGMKVWYLLCSLSVSLFLFLCCWLVCRYTN
jgi:1-aminocyclopropane-1-carboxylate deaminase/D-cysteine desulfhydrase-like pyridoxal-dependent ACC family enzyme